MLLPQLTPYLGIQAPGVAHPVFFHEVIKRFMGKDLKSLRRQGVYQRLVNFCQGRFRGAYIVHRQHRIQRVGTDRRIKAVFG